MSARELELALENVTLALKVEALETKCAAIEHRVWNDPTRLSMFRVPETDTVIDEDGEVLHVVLCPRCNGAGKVSFGWCYACIGARWTLQSDKGVRRTARWWQTYQQNRTP